MIKYKIGNEFLDQFDDNSSFAITKAVSKVGEINLRHGDRSTGFKVPLTSKNTRILNYITELSSATSKDVFKKITGQLIEDEAVISEGYYQVVNFSPYKNSIDMRFYGGNTDWFNDLKNKKINESSSDFKYNVEDIGDIAISADAIVDTFATELTEQTPFKFFLVDNNKETTRNSADDATLFTDFSDYQLGVSQGVIFDRIMRSIDVNTKGNMFNDPKYYNTLISSSTDINVVEENQSDPIFTAKITQDTTQTIDSTSGANYSSIYYNTTDPSPEFDGNTITFKSNASGLSLQAKNFINIFGFGATSSGVTVTKRIWYRIVKNKNTTGEIILDQGIKDLIEQEEKIGTIADGTTTSYYYPDSNIVFLGGGIGFVTGDTVNIEYSTDVVNTSASGDPLVSDYSNKTGQGQPFLTFQLEGYTKETTAKGLIPNIDQASFVKDVLVQFGAITQYNQKTRTLTCNRFDVIDDSRSLSIDWSKKIDLSKPPKVDLTNILKGYGKRSFFKYEEADESDVLNKLYKAITNYQIGDGAIIIDNDFIQDDKDVYKSPYAPTITVGTFPFSDSDETKRANFFLPFVPLFTKTADNEFEENDLNPRKFLHLGNININDSYKGSCSTVRIGSGVVNRTFTSMPLVYFDKYDYPYNFDSPLNNFQDTLSFGVIQDLTTNTRSDDLLKDINISTQSQNKTILNDSYTFQKKILDKPIYLEIYLRLSPIDVQNVDFFTPIFLDFNLDSGGYYYIDEISQYKGQDQSTKVKLVKI